MNVLWSRLWLSLYLQSRDVIQTPPREHTQQRDAKQIVDLLVPLVQEIEDMIQAVPLEPHPERFANNVDFLILWRRRKSRR